MCSHRASDQLASRLPSNQHRSAIIHSLASNFGLFKPNGQFQNLFNVKPSPATIEELETYHDHDYVGMLTQLAHDSLC